MKMVAWNMGQKLTGKKRLLTGLVLEGTVESFVVRFVPASPPRFISLLLFS